jgi:hypothetical protein
MLVAVVLDVTLSVDVLPSAGVARTRIAAAIEQIVCIAVSLSLLEDEGSMRAVTPGVELTTVENIT